ncbi:MAG: hypothetical protein ACE5LU_10565, partial [Anaerolineae bacterium]
MGATRKTRINPIRDPLPEGVFTDREEILDQLRRWAALAPVGGAKSDVLLGPRRVGKSAVLEQFYNDLFWEQDQVCPFLFEIPDRLIWEKQFAMDYFGQVIRQFAAFVTKDPSFFLPREEIERGERKESLQALQARLSAEGQDYLAGNVEGFLAGFDDDIGASLVDWGYNTPLGLATRTDIPVIVMLDEFQRLDEGIFCVDRERKRRVTVRMTGGFSILAESWRAPMLVCGSAVSFMTRKVLTRGLNGRFRAPYHLGPMSVEDGAELALRLARRFDEPVTLDSAYKISQLAGGHPFYIRVALLSKAKGKDLSTDEGVAAVFDYEVERGEIYKFWNSHFQANLKALGEEAGDDTSQRILFYLMKWEEETPEADKKRVGGLDYEIAARDLGLNPSLTKQKLDLLVEADILPESRPWGFYRGVQDEMMKRVLLLDYGPGIRRVDETAIISEVEAELRAKIEVLERERAGLRGRMNDLLGKATEVAVQRLMKRHFKNQVVDGRFFNVEGEVLLPAFHRVWSVLTRVEGAEGYEIDNFGEPLAEGQPCWVTEQKAWAQAFPLAEAERFWQAAEALREDRGLERVVLWLYARSG